MIYLDNNATTPIDPRILQKIHETENEYFGNPSSLYPIGRKAKDRIEEAREIIAKYINAKKEEIFFTSSGTESDNWAIRGILDVSPDKNEIIVSSIEHPAIINTCKYLEKKGIKVFYVPVDHEGIVDLDFIKDKISERTALISIMHANNEIGSIQPIEEIGKIASERKVVFHSDCVQSLGKIEIDVEKLKVDLLSISAHKLYGPKGVGALYIKKGVNILPLMLGGHQEKGRRAGTENVLGIIGFGEAVKILHLESQEERKRIKTLSEMLKKGIESKISDVKFNGHPEKRIPSTLNFCFSGIDGEALVMALSSKDIYVSTGSACTEGEESPSHVLLSIGLSPEEANSSVRFSIGRFNKEEEISKVLDEVSFIVEKLRELKNTDNY
ncbi:MAG: cysteine desulfurase family protein [Acidobacteriota bacterium]